MIVIDGTWIITIGLLFDIVGVAVLSYPLIVSKKQAAELAATKWNGNNALKELFRRQSISAIWGITIMSIGFSLQIYGTWLLMK